jgi:uncharacterized protein YhbP (UPF0306 family)
MWGEIPDHQTGEGILQKKGSSVAEQMSGVPAKEEISFAQRTQTLQSTMRQVSQRYYFHLPTGFAVHRVLSGMFLEIYRLKSKMTDSNINQSSLLSWTTYKLFKG